MRRLLAVASTVLAGFLLAGAALAEDNLRQEFLAPPDSAKPWCYWWWLNGAASKEGITRDFNEMKKQGIAGALLFDAGEAGDDAPRGPQFMSPEWRELYKHALREADRCRIALGVNLCSGWNCGGPWVTQEHAAKKLVSAQAVVQGPGPVTLALPRPPAVEEFYRDLVVLAAPIPADAPACRLLASSQYQDYGPSRAEDGDDQSRWVSNGNKPGMGPTPEKPEFLQFEFSEPWNAAGLFIQPYRDCGPEKIEIQSSDDGRSFRSLLATTLKSLVQQTVPFNETPARYFRINFLTSQAYRGGNWNVQVSEIGLLSKDQAASQKPPARFLWNRAAAVDVSEHMNPDGELAWNAPAGTWKVLRIGFTLHGNKVKCVGSGPQGLEIDTMSAEAMEAHFAQTGAKLIADAGPLAGKTLQYFHIDSWELGQPTWTPKMPDEFRRRRGYDPLPWLPALVGQVIDDDAETRRFLQDYRRTAADLVAENYYGRLRDLTVAGGLRGTHPESGGPFFTHWIDAIQCEGINDVPMGEFWKRNSEPDGAVTHHHNPSLKQAACAMHVYGKRDCQAEAYTSFACDWIDDPWTMKDIGDAALCEGLTRNVLCFWVHQPNLADKPGYQWAHVGTHFDCNLTWWPMSEAWLTYLARCQHLLRQGLFVADFAYLLDETVPTFAAPRPDQDPPRPAGFDYDVLNAEVLLGRASAAGGRLTLPDGMSYRYLVLPHQPEAVLSAATVKKINELADAGVPVIGPPALVASVPKLRQGPLDAVTRADRLTPDVELRELSPQAAFDWIHRRQDDTDIYFVSNQASLDATATVVFRIAGRKPELWDAVTGSVRDLPQYRQTDDGRTEVPLQFAPRQSWFVVFRARAQKPDSADQKSPGNFPPLRPLDQIAGPWQVQFDPQWFYPDNGTGGKLQFDTLQDWTTRPEDAVRYYSGIATYRNRFEMPALPAAGPLFLDLGRVSSIARVRLNGRDLGVAWTAPWRVEIPAGLLRSGSNHLEIEVANLWPNRLAGDGKLPPPQRRTRTNVRTYDDPLPPEQEYRTYNCALCADRRKTGSPAPLVASGLLGPVTLQAAATP
ncbi:MAG: glycosyl hydrolase [Thermoguttaceae bacterium]